MYGFNQPASLDAFSSSFVVLSGNTPQKPTPCQSIKKGRDNNKNLNFLIAHTPEIQINKYIHKKYIHKKYIHKKYIYMCCLMSKPTISRQRNILS